MDRDPGRPQWVVEVLAMDAERGEVIRVTVAGDEGAVGDDELKPDRFPGTRFPAEDHVPLGQGDLDPAAEFVSTQVHGFPDRQRATGMLSAAIAVHLPGLPTQCASCH
jgi:hypothetical protein